MPVIKLLKCLFAHLELSEFSWYKLLPYTTRKNSKNNREGSSETLKESYTKIQTKR